MYCHLVYTRRHVVETHAIYGLCSQSFLLTSRRTTIGTEFSAVYRSAGTGPAVVCRLRLSAVGTELACVCSAAFAGPFGRLGSCRSVAALALSAVSAEFTAV